MKRIKYLGIAVLTVLALIFCVTAFAAYSPEILYEDITVTSPETVENTMVIETEEPEIFVPTENTIEYDEPQIEIPDTGSKNPFWAVAVCIIGMGAVFALALI